MLPNVTLLVGENGTGKTSLLEVLLRLLSQSNFEPDWVREGAPRGSLQAKLDGILHPTDRPGLTGTRAERWYSISAATTSARADSDDERPSVFVAGYSENRRSGSRLEAPGQPTRIPSFVQHELTTELRDADVWLNAFKGWSERGKEAIALLGRLLPPELQLADSKHEKQPFRFRGRLCAESELPWGYRTYLAWVADLIARLCSAVSDEATLLGVRGVVLVDELDQHMHPAWQRTVLRTLSQQLPSLQFVVSTHSPLVTGTAEPENVYVLEADTGGTVSARHPGESLFGLNADQVLISPYFGLPSSRAPGALNELRRKALDAYAKPEEAERFLRALARGPRADLEGARFAVPRRAETRADRRPLGIDSAKSATPPQERATNLRDESDPQKGRWGGQAARDGFKLSATVKPFRGRGDWFEVRLEVSSTTRTKPLEGKVEFHLHPTFEDDVQSVTSRAGKAVLRLVAYGAFTVGARLRDVKPEVTLELDLMDVPNAPESFRAH